MADMKLNGTIAIVRRVAQQEAKNGSEVKRHILEPCKGVLQVRNRSDGRQMLLVADRAGAFTKQLNMNKIQQLRMKYIENGIAGMEVPELQMNIIVRECNPSELKKFMTHVQNVCKMTGSSNVERSQTKVGLNLGTDEGSSKTSDSDPVRPLSNGIRLLGTVSVINRLAQAVGCGTNSRVFRPCKGILQVRTRSEGRQMLVVSTRKDITAQEYNVHKILNLRTKNLSSGFATIDISEPPMSILIRDCDVTQLTQFMNQLEALSSPTVNSTFVANKDLPILAMLGTESGTEMETSAPPDPRVSKRDFKSFTNSSSSGASSESTMPRAKVSSTSASVSNSSLHLPRLEQTDEPESPKEAEPISRKLIGSYKRARSPELSKACKEQVKKVLLSTNTSITVKKRENYPKEFPSTLEKLQMSGIGLRKIDNRMLKLRYLTKLDLSENQLKSVNELANFTCQLKSLILAGNQIKSLPNDFFSSPTFRGLSFLNLSNNQLSTLPVSFNRLDQLANAKLNDNQLTFLPYNLKGLKSLTTLDLSNNSLAFIPETMTLISLSSLDISGNPAVTSMNALLPRIDYVGYADIPTLFEKCCEIMMNKPQISAPSTAQDIPLWPTIVDTYLNGGKYCMTCGKMSLRYRITSMATPTRSLCVAQMSRCLISPVSECIVKNILCYNCDMKAKRRRSTGWRP